MTTNAEFFAWISSQAGVSALIGDRIYPRQLPQGVIYPCIRFLRDDDGGFKDFDGQGGTLMTELQIDCIADTLTQAEAIAAEVSGAMKNYTGAMGGRTVQRVSLESEFDAYEPSLAEGKYRVSQAWTIWHY